MVLCQMKIHFFSYWSNQIQKQIFLSFGCMEKEGDIAHSL